MEMFRNIGRVDVWKKNSLNWLSWGRNSIVRPTKHTQNISSPPIGGGDFLEGSIKYLDLNYNLNVDKENVDHIRKMLIV